MIWSDLNERISVLYYKRKIILRIRKRGEGNFPFSFEKKPFFINYSGGFKTMESAKEHAENKVRELSKIIENFNNGNDCKNQKKESSIRND